MSDAPLHGRYLSRVHLSHLNIHRIHILLRQHHLPGLLLLLLNLR